MSCTKKDPWYVVARRIVIAPFAVPGFIVFFLFWKYAIGLGTVRAVLRLFAGRDKNGRRKEPSRFPFFWWLVANYVLWTMHSHLRKKQICEGMPNCLHTIRLIQGIWNACRRNGEVVVGYFQEMKDCLEQKAFTSRDLTFFKKQKGGVFSPSIRDLIKCALQIQRDDLAFVLWCFTGACELLSRQPPLPPFVDIVLENKEAWTRGIYKFGPFFRQVLVNYAEYMLHTSLDFKDKEAAHLWAKAGQCAEAIRQILRRNEASSEMQTLVDAYCEYANDAGARVYLCYLEVERAREEEAVRVRVEEVEAKRRAEEKSAEKARRKAERKARKAAEKAERDDPNTPKTVESVLTGQHGRFEFMRRKKGRGITIHDVHNKRFYRHLSAPKALEALKDLFVQYGDGASPVECCLPCNDQSWKGSFNYGDLQKFYNEQTQTWGEAHPDAAADERYEHPNWRRIIPDDQPIKKS